MKYKGSVFTGNGYQNKHIGYIEADSLPVLKQKASRLCNGYFNSYDRLEVIYHGEIITTEYIIVFRRYNKKYPNNTIIRDKWR